MTSVIEQRLGARVAHAEDAERRPIPFGRPMIGDEERRAVTDVLMGSTLTHGPLVRKFEQDFAAFTGAPHAIATSSCAGALHAVGMALGLGAGDEVLVSAQTHVATAHAIELCGARCVFIDSEPKTGNIDPGLIEAAITERTKAIAIVHYLGVPAQMTPIVSVARSYGLAIIEDCALALGATIEGRHVGLFGDAGCFSFYPVKHITTMEGGMIITRRADLAEAVQSIRAFGIDRNVVQERPIPGQYDVPQLGLNSRLSEVGAALGIEQLKRLPGFLQVRRSNFEALARALSGIAGIRILSDGTPIEHCGCYCLVGMLDDGLSYARSEVICALQAKGVGTSVYYPHPVPRLKYYAAKYATPPAAYVVAAGVSDRSIAFPVGPHVTSEDITHIAASVDTVLREVHGR